MALSTGIPAVLARFSGLRALVIGDAMLDTYLRGTTDRLCPEAPVPVVAITDRTDSPGGAANTAANARALGAHVTLLAAIGDDGEGRVLRRSLENEGVEARALLCLPGRGTLAKQRVVAGSQLLVRFDQGTTARLAPTAEAEIARRIQKLAPEHDAVIVSDYGYGVLSTRAVEALANAQRRAPKIVVVDARDPGAYRCVAPTAVKPNFREAARLLGDLADQTRSADLGARPGSIPPARGAALRWDERARAIERRGRALLELTGAQIVAVTLDSEGALFFERGREPYRTYGRPTTNHCASGAGDTLGAALALSLAAGADLPSAAEIASAAASIVVEKHGTATASLAEVRARIAAAGKVFPDVESLAPDLERLRRAGARIVLTSGCFDILHRGHIACLNAAKALGDVLIVGLNTDAGVRRAKGEARPVNPLDDRAAVLAGLSCVDRIVAFDEDTPERLAAAVRPHVFVKGGDYTLDSLPEARVVQSHGGTIRILPYVEDRSTTSIIERIRSDAAAARPPERLA